METIDGKKVRHSNEGIPQGVDNTELFQFADDLCIVVWSKDMCDTTEKLQGALNSILRLVTELGMDISPNKSKAIWFNSQGDIYKPRIKIHGNSFRRAC